MFEQFVQKVFQDHVAGPKKKVSVVRFRDNKTQNSLFHESTIKAQRNILP